MPQDGYGSVSAPDEQIDRASDYKPERVTWGEVLVAGAERLNDAMDSDDRHYLPEAGGPADTDALADAVAERIGADISEAIWDVLDADELAQQTAAYVESTDTVTLEASERRRIAEEVVGMLR